MRDMLERASDWLDAMRLEHMSGWAVYARGEDSVDVRAAIGKSVFEIVDAYGVMERVESRDYLVPAADLVLDGDVTLPARGDQIKETDGGKVFVYEVMAPGNEPHFVFSDPYRKTLRIHTKHVGTEEAT